MIHRIIITLIAVFGISFAVAQDTPTVTATSLEAISTSSEIRGEGGFYSEDFETFTVGPLVGQGGWGTSAMGGNAANSSVIDPGLNGSSRAALHTSSDSDIVAADIISPGFNDANYLELQQILSGNETTYFFSPQNSDTGLIHTRIIFELDGTMNALQFVNGGAEFLPTTGSWSPGMQTTIGIEVNDAGELFIIQDGVEIFAGTDINFALNGTAAPINSLANLTDNAGDSTNTQTWDSIVTAAGRPIVLPESQPVPVNNIWAMSLLVLLLTGLGVVVIRRIV